MTANAVGKPVADTQPDSQTIERWHRLLHYTRADTFEPIKYQPHQSFAGTVVRSNTGRLVRSEKRRLKHNQEP